ncbi:MAG: MgtC/SapB family protein [Sandaracinaceae bacterium]
MPDLPSTLGDDARILARVVVAMLVAVPLGWERERRQRPAGLRTHLLVAMSAALLVSLATPMVEALAPHGGLRFDPLRVFVAVIGGVSIVGAGTIVVDRTNGGVRGLTTAASLLATATIGIAAGLERYVVAIGTSALAVLVLSMLAWVERRLEGR